MFDAYVRKAIEHGKPIFPTKYVLDGEDFVDPALPDGDPRKYKSSLARAKASQGAYRFSCQMMNDPVADDTIEFKREYFRQFLLDDDIIPKLKAVKGLLAVDPAFRLKQTNDYTGFTVSKMTKDNYIHILEASQKKLPPDAIIDHIFQLVKAYDIDRVLIETVSAQILLAQQLKKEMVKRNVQFGLIEVTPPNDTTKAMRIRSLVPFYAAGQVLHRKGLIDLENQLIEFPRNTHDDIIDSLAYHVPYWKENGTMKTRPVETEGTLAWWEKKLPTRGGYASKLFKDVIRKKRSF